MMGLFSQMVFEFKGTIAESLLRFPVLGDIISMTGDSAQMESGACPVFVDGFSAPARYALKEAGITVLAYNNNGVIWVSPADAELANELLSRY